MSETFTGRLRRRTKERLATGDSVRAQAAAVGVSHSSLWRFLRGCTPSADLIDHLVAWLDVDVDVERLARALEPHFGPSYVPGRTDVTIHGESPRAIAEELMRDSARLTDEAGT